LHHKRAPGASRRLGRRAGDQGPLSARASDAFHWRMTGVGASPREGVGWGKNRSSTPISYLPRTVLSPENSADMEFFNLPENSESWWRSVRPVARPGEGNHPRRHIFPGLRRSWPFEEITRLPSDFRNAVWRCTPRGSPSKISAVRNFPDRYEPFRSRGLLRAGAFRLARAWTPACVASAMAAAMATDTSNDARTLRGSFMRSSRSSCGPRERSKG
jgi:hypothetical protein